jgi:plasmid maintenance system antidote protein VapI
MKNFKIVKGNQNSGVTTFGDVLHAICAELRLSQFQLATIVGYSEAAISRVVTGSRPLSRKLAEKLEEKIGGSTESWLLVYGQTKEQGSGLSVTHFRDLLLGKEVYEDLPGIQVRRMRRQEIIDIFGNTDGSMTFRGKTEDCEIDPFFPEAVQKAVMTHMLVAILIKAVLKGRASKKLEMRS